jgi:hypothetical protein
MDLIKYLLKNVFKLAVILFVAAFVLWLGRIFYPGANLARYASSTGIGYFFSGDWLPAPHQAGLITANPTVHGFTYEPGPAYNGYSNSAYANNIAYVSANASGTQVTYPGQSGGGNGQGGSGTYSDRSLYIRNLSIYDGANIAYGQTIYGEARQEMFKNGSFTVVVIDRSGKTFASFPAINTGTWAAPGWARFQMTVSSRLPYGTECALVFFSGTQSIKVGMPVTCR